MWILVVRKCVNAFYEAREFWNDINLDSSVFNRPRGRGVHRDPIIVGPIVIVNDVNLQISKRGSTLPLSLRRKNYSPQEATKNCIIFRFWVVTDPLNPLAARFVGTLSELSNKNGEQEKMKLCSDRGTDGKCMKNLAGRAEAKEST